MQMKYAFLAAFAAATSLPAQNPLEVIRANLQPVELREDRLTGEGAVFLLEEAGRARFFLIGESHGNRETCRVTSWLLDELADRKYGAYAIETGPCSTDLLVGVAGEKGVAGVLELSRQFPFSLAFLNWREEVDVLVRALEKGYGVWGLDQEFIGSGRLLTRELMELAPDEGARLMAAEWHEKALDGFADFARSGDQSRGFMNIVQGEDFDQLDRAFADASSEAIRILAELRASAAVYRHFQEGRFYLNNRDRIRLMKRHFADHLAETDTKVLMKFGSAHMGRGHSPFDQLDLGNQAAELAFARGGDSFHLYVFARKSVQADGSERNFAESTPYMEPLYELLPPGGGVVDLRALRPFCNSDRVKETMPELCDLVRRFDAALILPAFHPSTEIVPMGR